MSESVVARRPRETKHVSESWWIGVSREQWSSKVASKQAEMAQSKIASSVRPIVVGRVG